MNCKICGLFVKFYKFEKKASSIFFRDCVFRSIESGIALCLLRKYLGLHKINGRKGEGHIVELPLERGFVLLLGRIWMFWRFVFRCFSLTGISMLLLWSGIGPDGFRMDFMEGDVFPGVSWREYKAGKGKIVRCVMVVQSKTKSDLSRNRSLHYFVTPTGLKPVTF